MSGLFRRLSSRRSDGPEGAEPPAQAEPGATDAPAANAPDQPGGHESLLVDPAAPTRVLRGDNATTYQRPGEDAAVAQGAGTSAEAHAQAPGAEGGVPADPAHPGVPPQVHGPEPVAPPGAEGSMLPASDLPAGLDPDELAAAPPTSARRGRLRKRVSFLRAAREVLLRDLGGFAYELHRTAGDIPNEAHRRLREIKLARLTRLDIELHELELRLDDVRRHVMVREPGVGGECPHCGELFGSDAHYCSHCGLPLTESARRAVAREATPSEAAPADAQPAAPQDQPTEEYSPLRAGDPEFAWPARPAADEAQTGVIGGADQPVGGAESPEAATPATGAERGAAAAAAGPADAEAPKTGDEAEPATAGEAPSATGAEPRGAEHPAETGPAPADEAPAATGAEPRSAQTPAETDTAPTGEAPSVMAPEPRSAQTPAETDTAPAGEAPAATGAEPRSAQTPAEAHAAPAGEAPSATDAAARDEATAEPPAPSDASAPEQPEDPAGDADGGAAGRNGTAFSPVERRR